MDQPQIPTTQSETTLENKKPVDLDNDPPHSRLFVVCPKTLDENDIVSLFSPFGQIQYCKFLRDKTTQEAKGLCYVKYEKSSSAALAIENLHAQKVDHDDSSPPLKVLIAEPKGSNTGRFSSSDPEDLPPRSRLFVICPKEASEDEITQGFHRYPEMEYCKVMRDRTTNQPKGFAFVKFAKSSIAAKAMEEINAEGQLGGVKMKVLIAEPKNKREISKLTTIGGGMGGGMGEYEGLGSFNQMSTYGNYVGYGSGDPNLPMPADPSLSYGLQSFQPPRQRLFVVCHKTATQEQLFRIFSRIPGMEYLDLKKSKQTGESKGFAYVNYSTPQAAFVAKQQLDGFEYPPGYTLKVIFAEPLGVKPSSSSFTASSFSSSTVPFSSSQYDPSMPAFPTGGYMGSSQQPMMTYGSIPPSRDHPASGGDGHHPEGSRLFLVVSKPLPDYVLQSVFSPFEGFEYLKFHKEKNFGYVKYSTANTAMSVMQYMNGTEISGAKIKLQIANPPPDPRKRQRTTPPSFSTTSTSSSTPPPSDSFV